MDSKNVNKEKVIPQEELSWDDIDYDEVVRNLVVEKENKRKMLERQQIVIQTRNTEEDGNYFDKQQSIKKEKQQKQHNQIIQKACGHNQNNYVQSFSHKDLIRIKNFTNCSSTFHNLLFETYGHFDKFIATHDEESMPHENLVELLNIDIALLSIPFDSHANFLLKGICGIPSFWSQLLSFLKEFLHTKHKNLSFLLVVDMNTFFINLEIMFHKVLVNDFMNSSMTNIFKELIKVLEDNSNITEWSKPARFLEIKAEYDINNNEFKIYDVSLRIVISFIKY